MTEPDDILDKADAFLKRYHPSSATAKHDVPVLTEIVEEARTAPASPAPSAAAQAPVNSQLQELEQKLREVIDAHVKSAVAGASTQLKADLETAIREAVARAVAAEMVRLRGPSRGA